MLDDGVVTGNYCNVVILEEMKPPLDGNQKLYHQRKRKLPGRQTAGKFELVKLANQTRAPNEQCTVNQIKPGP